ncbi:MAG: dihydrodipicolinate synthase family protein [Pseudonocardiaceae bacterium]
MHSDVIVPLVTPLDETGAVSERSVARLIESLHGNVTAFMPALSSGEGWALTEQQWHHMVSATRAHAGGRPVLAGIQLPDTTAVIDRAAVAAALGAEAIVVTTPFGSGVTQEEIYRHYAEISAAVRLPLFVYNEAALSGNHIDLGTLVRICRLPGVVGIKESSGSPELTRRIVDAVPWVPVFEGWEHLLLEAREVAGFIGPLANLEPRLCQDMLDDPTAPRQADINETCARYGLLTDDWYRPLKRELARRGVLATDRTVATQEVTP